MTDGLDLHSFFEAVIKQDAVKLRAFFESDATVVWANTEEQFTVEEYIRANCEYPGEWNGRIEDIQCCSGLDESYRIALVAKVWDRENNASRVVSFIKLSDTGSRLIKSMVEYWGDVSKPPEWRRRLGIGKQYREKTQ